MREERERLRRIKHGLIPWDVHSCIEAYTFAVQLRTTPKDDWDHKERSFPVDLSQQPEAIRNIIRSSLANLAEVDLMKFSEESPGLVVAKFNSSAFANQISAFILDQSDDLHAGKAHVVRFLEMDHFFCVHRHRLLKAGVMRLTGDIHEALLTALCELPYKGRRRQGPSGFTPTFKLAAVLKRAAELRAEEDSGDTSEQ